MMPGLDRFRIRVRPGAALLAVAGAGVAGVFALLFLSLWEEAGPAQPIPFSHRLHAGVKRIDCRFCHPFVDRSSDAGVPAVKKCLFCHEYILPEHPQIRKLQRYYDTGIPVPWKRLFVAKDHVFFRHSPHVRKGIDCAECHGDVARMDRIPAHDFEMGFCIRCHRERGANLGCWLGCHN
jgi:hypothetical protein